MHHDPNASPNLFLVGAPKCGTTSLYEYLRQHPQIFFPEFDESDTDNYWKAKEPKFFCPDLEIKAACSIKNLDEYLTLYAKGTGKSLRGDASVYYLSSEVAPELIKSFCPSARILIMLRPPVAMLRSYHKDLLRTGWEEIGDFHEAIAASEDRRRGLQIPSRTATPRSLDYLSISRFAPQVERYLHAFGRQAVKIILLEDMIEAPERTFREILTFLAVDTSFKPEFRVFNETPGQGKLERFARFAYSMPAMNAFVRTAVPYRVRRAVLAVARHTTQEPASSDPRDDELRKLCSPDIERLAGMIGRDLSHWTQ